jgi:O-antigen/teichoic acid export membrane protein
VLAVADQAFSSASNFLVGILVARLAGPRAFGAFALAYAAWLAIVGVHRAVVTDPLLIGDRPHDRDTDLVARGLAADVLVGLVGAAFLGLVGGVLQAMISGPLAVALLSLAPWVVFLVVQDYWRWVAFMRLQPGKALANDVAYTLVQVAIIVIVGVVDERPGLVPVIAAWGLGAFVGSVLGLAQFGVRPSARGGVAFLREAWPTGRWLLADFATYYGASRAYLFAVAAVLGPVGLGGLRAAQNLMGPSNVFLLAGGSVGLPASVEALRDRGVRALGRIARSVTVATAGVVGAYGLVVAALGGRLMVWGYGSSYEQFGGLVALAAAQYTIAAAGRGPNLALKAVRQTGLLFGTRVVTAIVSVTSALALGHRFGAVGAGWSAVLTVLVNVVLVWGAFLKFRDRALSADEVSGPKGGGRLSLTTMAERSK